MKVIVAGFPKTGTKSITRALKQLGFEVYDFVEHMYYLEREWDNIFNRAWTTKEFYEMYKDVDAAVDIPASYFWEEIHKAFPDAKIILTVRDSEEVWAKSLKNHFRVMDGHFLARAAQLIEILLQRKTGLLLTTSYKVILSIDRAVWKWKTQLNESILKMKYRAHNAHVMQNAPQDKLLVFNCKQGWSPLCKFLEVQIPGTPFPHENIRASIVEDTANHPVTEKYISELLSALAKFIGKIIFICGILAFIFYNFV